MRLSDLQTPALILDRNKLVSNIEAMTRHIASKGIRLRPHLKTCKSIDVARLALKDNFGGVTVATLNEAEYFAGHGVRDILHGVCVTPDKLARIRRLQEDGVDVTVITDSLAVAQVLARLDAGQGSRLKVMAEIDCGEHRTGVLPDDPVLIEIARCLHKADGVQFAGVFTHAGHSYRCRSVAEIERVAEDERLAALQAVRAIQANGIGCRQVSVGSTPTALHARSVEGVSEVRPGVYMFNDLFQATLQSCEIHDIAVSVLATVISHDSRRNRLLIDAGGLALSKDRSTAGTSFDAGFGRLMDLGGQNLIGRLCVTDTHQEHGEVTAEAPIPFQSLPIGSRVRVLPNHACMTAAMYGCYHVVEGEGDAVSDIWPRTNGWQIPGARHGDPLS